MAKVLFIKANDRHQAVSIQLYDAFLKTYREANPHDRITELDLFKADLPYLDNTMITGLFKLAQGMEATPEERAAASVANRYLDQFLDADKVVFAFPLWNFSVPAQLMTYIHYLFQVGKVVKYTPEGAVGLLGEKKVALLNARGGIYSEGPAAATEMTVNYMKMVMGIFGITSLATVIVEGHNQLKEQAESIIAAGLREAEELAARF